MQYNQQTGKFQEVEEEDESRSLGFSDFFGSDAALNGAVSADSALRVSAVFSCVKAIAETVSTLPLHLYKSSDGASGTDRVKVKDHYISGFLDDYPNECMTWHEARECLTFQQVLRGNSFSRISWKRGFVESYDPLCEYEVTPQLTEKRKLLYHVSNYNGKAETLTSKNISHFKGLTANGIMGVSPIEVCRHAMTSATYLNEHGANQFKNGARLQGALKMPATFRNKEVRDRVRESWNAAYNGSNAQRVAILEDGLEWQNISMSLQDAQFIEQMNFSVEEVARIFSVPPHVIGHLTRSTNNNIEHQGKEFHQRTISPWLRRQEETMRRTLLTEDERKQGYFLAHDPDSILSVDFKTRVEGRAMQIQSGQLSINESRYKDNQKPVDGGDVVMVPLNHIPLDQFGNEPVQPAANKADPKESNNVK